MANKDQRGGRETRKPKKEKPKPQAAASSFIVSSSNPSGKGGKKG